MAAESAPYSGPQLNVETWIERGNSGDWLTRKGGTGDTAHFEISHDPQADEQWIREYAAGRKAFQEPRINAARSFADEKPAEAVISARMALEIPWRGREFLYNQGVVVRAMGLENYVNKEKATSISGGAYKGMEVIWEDLDRTGTAMEEAFDTPYDVKTELKDIANNGRERIKSSEIEAWTAAVNFFGESSDLQAAGLGAAELGAAYERQDKPDDAVATFKASSDLLKSHLEKVMALGEPSRHSAEIEELATHIVEAQSGVLRVLSKKDRVEGLNKELLKAAVYDLDDYGAPQQKILDGYKVLARSSHFKEKRFYKREAAGIAGEIAVANFFTNIGGILFNGPEPRSDRRHLRPPIELPN